MIEPNNSLKGSLLVVVVQTLRYMLKHQLVSLDTMDSGYLDANTTTEMTSEECNTTDPNLTRDDWSSYEQQIRLLEEQLGGADISIEDKLVAIDDIKIQIGHEKSTVQFVKLKIGGQSMSQQVSSLERDIAEYLGRIEELQLVVQQKQTEINLQNTQISTMTLQSGKTAAFTRLKEDQARTDLLRVQNQNKLLNEQINRLKTDLAISSKSLNKSLTTFPSTSIQTQTDSEAALTVDSSRKPGVQVLRIQSNFTGRKPLFLKQVGVQTETARQMILPVGTPILPSQIQHQNQKASEENKHLREIVQSLSRQLEIGQKDKINIITNLGKQQQEKKALSTDVLGHLNKIWELQQANKSLAVQVQKLKRDISSHTNTIKTLESQINNQVSNKRIIQGDEGSRRWIRPEEGSTHNKQAINTSNALRLEIQNRQLQRKLDDQKRDKGSQSQRHQLQVSRLASDLKNAIEQKSSLQKELISAKSQSTLAPLRDQSERKIRQLQSQIRVYQSQKLANQKDNTASLKYQSEKREHQRERKNLSDNADRYKVQISTTVANYNKATQDINVLKNQKNKLQGQLVKSQNESMRSTSELQKLKIELEHLNRKVKTQELEIANLRSVRTVSNTPFKGYPDKSVQNLNQEIRGLLHQNEELKQAVMGYKQLMNNKNLAILNQKLDSYETQIRDNNNYIASLLDKISELEDTVGSFENENQQLRMRIVSPGYESQDTRKWDDSNSELQYQQKISQKLSEHVKQLKVENDNLLNEIDDKDQIISTLNLRLIQLNNPRQKTNQANRMMNHMEDLEHQYNDLLALSKERANRMGSSQVTSEVTMLRSEIESYRNQLDKALQINNYLKQCLSQGKREGAQCQLCEEFQQIIIEMQRRIKIYDMNLMEDFKRMFVKCDTRLQETGYTWAQLQDRIYYLRQKMPPHKRTYDSLYVDRQMEESPVSVQKIPLQSRGRVTKRQRRLDDLIKYESLPLDAVIILMLRICESLMASKSTQVALPDCIYILHLDPNNPSQMKVELIQNKVMLDERHKLYLAPQVLGGGQHTSKSSCWNLGIVFQLILSGRLYFQSCAQITDRLNVYQYQNLEFPEFKCLMEGMLDKDPARRLSLERVAEMLEQDLEKIVE